VTTHLARVFGPDAEAEVSTWCSRSIVRQHVTTRISLVDCASCRAAFAAMLRVLPDVVPTPPLRAGRSTWEEAD
jgi:hypothetical protein